MPNTDTKTDVFKPHWPETLESGTNYKVLCDDKGRNGGSWLNVYIDEQGDVFVMMQDWEDIPEGDPTQFPCIRVRTHAGGGRNLRTAQALRWLAEAIRLDNEENGPNDHRH